ncbi:hypothetical protein MXC99_02195 [Thauera aromatica]|uniref:hypothetical protein n=1 Tax=Thauera aromatica TaxID=59405 RepID=UPI001FFD6ADE|nr:hypothetical protein [Thauera aromatica]MCK2086995.1 hypothetical protein [Thauera aromatica]
MRKTPPPLVEQAIHLRRMGLSFREISARVPGLSRSAAHRAVRNVPILLRKGRGWPDRRGWAWVERADAPGIDPLAWGAILNAVAGPPR